MKNYSECFKVVKKDCFKFISSQETHAEKFKNKHEMVEKFLIPVCFWIARKIINNNTLIIGLSGGQGTGKTTTSSLIEIIIKSGAKLFVCNLFIQEISLKNLLKFKIY